MPDSVAEMEYRILLEFKPDDSVTRSLLGMAHMRQNKLSEAEKAFRLILQTEPKNFDALDSLGLVLLKGGRYREAAGYLVTAATIRPEDILVHLHLGHALSNNGQSDMARETLLIGLNLLTIQPPSAAQKQQQTEFHTALAALPKKPATASRQ